MPASYGSDQTGPVRVCLLAWGSRGDVQPFVALARGLRDAGWSVAVAAGDDFEPLVRGAGVEFEPFGLSMADLLEHPVVVRWLTESSGSPRAELRNVAEVTRVFERPAVEGLLRVVDRYDAFVSGLLTADTLASVAPRRGRRHVLGLLAPGAPTRRGDALLQPVVARTSLLNLAGSTVGSLLLLRLGARIRRGVEERLGLSHHSVLRQVRLLSRTPTLLGASPHVVPTAPEWRDTTVTGAWVLPPEPWEPDRETADFLAAEPVHVGLGSMPVADEARVRTVVEATLERLDLRATAQGSWARRTDRVLPLGDVPHGRLFPQVRAVVHHGGAGTTGAVVRAGVPQVVVPHMGDQPYWGRRVAALGCGPDPLPLHDLTVASLADRLGRAVAGSHDRAAAALADVVRTEDGVGTAVTRLRQLWGSTS